MKVVDFTCPHCGGALQIEEGRKQIFCEYCGAKLLFDDGTIKVVTVIRDEAKLRELELQKEEQLRKEEALKWKKLDTIIVATFIIMIIVIGKISYGIENKSHFVENLVATLCFLDMVNLAVLFGRFLYRHRYDDTSKSKKKKQK